MKLTTLICCGILIAFGVFAAVYALSGFDLLLFLCANHYTVYRALLSLARCLPPDQTPFVTYGAYQSCFFKDLSLTSS